MATARPDTHFFPIRHQSPACAAHLARALNHLRPARLLLEMPSDFTEAVARLTAPGTVPPVAIVSLPPATAEEDAGRVAYYPFCDHSPELVAIRWAARTGATLDLIDLPSRDKQQGAASGGTAEPGPLLLTAEVPFSTNDYIQALCRRTGARDGNELWDRLFESRLTDPDWQRFFDALAAHCAHMRDTATPDELTADGTLAREAHMIARLHAAWAEESGPIAVITGGFHTPALVATDPSTAPAAAPPSGKAGRVSLVRYDFTRLDRANGYASGLPSPGYYDRLWRCAEALPDDAAPLWDTTAIHILAAFSEHLRQTSGGPRLPLPVLTTAAEMAARLASLRGLPGPGRCELLDALQSTAIKDAQEVDRAPVLRSFSAFLTGDRMGDVPPGSGSVPLVDSVRRMAKALGFSLDRATKATRTLDIHGKRRHAAASRFLHGLDIIGAGFAERKSGPDFRHGHRSATLNERWLYGWSPLVEAALIDRSGDGDSVEAVCRTVLLRTLAELETSGQGNNPVPAAALFRDGVLCGLHKHLPALAQHIETVLGTSDSLDRLTDAFGVLLRVRTIPNQDDGAEQQTHCLLARCYRRIVAILGDLTLMEPDEALEIIRKLADLAILLGSPGSDRLDLDPEPLRLAIADVLDETLSPLVRGAIGSVAVILGVLDTARLQHILAAAFSASQAIPGDRVGALHGILAVAPRFYIGNTALIDSTHAFLVNLTDDEFLAVLPALRRAFAELNPSETQRVAMHLPLGASAVTRQDSITLTARDLAENLALSQTLLEVLDADGLSGWMEAAS
jgi:hypothetical protein